jgi:hypothetical protein
MITTMYLAGVQIRQRLVTCEMTAGVSEAQWPWRLIGLKQRSRWFIDQ